MPRKRNKIDYWNQRIEKEDAEIPARHNRPTTLTIQQKQALATDTFILERLSQGASIAKIARETGHTVREVRDKFNEISKAYIQHAGDLVLQIKIEQDHQLAFLYEEALDAWRKSKEDIVDKDGNITAHNTGNIKYLDAARHTLKDIRDLWGAEAPIRIMHAHVRIQDETERQTRENPERMKNIHAILTELRQLPSGIPEEEVKDIIDGKVIKEEQLPQTEDTLQ